MSVEQWIGFLIIGIAIVGVLIVVFAVTVRVGRPGRGPSRRRRPSADRAASCR